MNCPLAGGSWGCLWRRFSVCRLNLQGWAWEGQACTTGFYLTRAGLKSWLLMLLVAFGHQGCHCKPMCGLSEFLESRAGWSRAGSGCSVLRSTSSPACALVAAAPVTPQPAPALPGLPPSLPAS